jgi:hypothetical protein
VAVTRPDIHSLDVAAENAALKSRVTELEAQVRKLHERDVGKNAEKVKGGPESGRGVVEKDLVCQESKLLNDPDARIAELRREASARGMQLQEQVGVYNALVSKYESALGEVEALKERNSILKNEHAAAQKARALREAQCKSSVKFIAVKMYVVGWTYRRKITRLWEVVATIHRSLLDLGDPREAELRAICDRRRAVFHSMKMHRARTREVSARVSMCLCLCMCVCECVYVHGVIYTCMCVNPQYMEKLEDSIAMLSDPVLALKQEYCNSQRLTKQFFHENVRLADDCRTLYADNVTLVSEIDKLTQEKEELLVQMQSTGRRGSVNVARRGSPVGLSYATPGKGMGAGSPVSRSAQLSVRKSGRKSKSGRAEAKKVEPYATPITHRSRAVVPDSSLERKKRSRVADLARLPTIKTLYQGGGDDPEEEQEEKEGEQKHYRPPAGPSSRWRASTNEIVEPSVGANPLSTRSTKTISISHHDTPIPSAEEQKKRKGILRNSLTHFLGVQHSYTAMPLPQNLRESRDNMRKNIHRRPP